MADGYDILLDGSKYRLVRTVEGTRAYRKSWQRQYVQKQFITDEVEQSRSDQAAFYQTSWHQGSRWEKPRMTEATKNMFVISSNMNTHWRPGEITPANNHNAAEDSNLLSTTPLMTYDGEVWAIGSTTNVSGSNRDLYKWTPASNAFVQQAVHSGYTGSTIWGAVPDSRNDRIFFMGGATCYQFDPDTPANGASVLATGLNMRAGSNLMIHNDRLLIWDADQLYEIEDPLGTPALSAAIANDGMGKDMLSGMDLAAAKPSIRGVTVKTAIATPDGIFYVKNVLTGDQPVPWVFRIDRDAAGNDISSPIATLPAGNMALSLGFLLGALIIATTPDWKLALQNDTDAGYPRVDFYHYTSFNGLNGLGRPLGDEPDETPSAILGSEGDNLIIGSHKRIWVYSAGTGGIHPWYHDPGGTSYGQYKARAKALNSTDDPITLYLGRQVRLMTVQDAEIGYDDPDTVVAFGDDETHYTLESGYFDFGLPMELKTLTSAYSHWGDNGSASNQYKVQLSIDDSDWIDIQTIGLGADPPPYGRSTYAAALNYTGYKFRYKLIYETKNTVRVPFKGIKFEATVGRMVPVWNLVLSGDQIINVDNQPQDPNAVFNSLELTAQKEIPVQLIDNWRAGGNRDYFDWVSATGNSVYVRSVEFRGQYGQETEIAVTLVGVPSEVNIGDAYDQGGGGGGG